MIVQYNQLHFNYIL